MKKLFLTSMFAVAFGLAITACGDDSSSGPEEESSSSVELDDDSSSSEESAESSSSENSGEETPESSAESGDAESSSSEAKKDDSSSSEAVSSSSEDASSSSIQRISLYDCGAYDCVSTEYLNQDILDTNGYGELLDTRNNKVYRTIVIGNQTWMAQNLNYQGVNNGETLCYGNDGEYCTKYGALYDWTAAQEACPEGWHLPRQDEFELLINHVDPTYSTGNTDESRSETAGEYLKTSSGWRNNENGNDYYGFSALPAGGFFSGVVNDFTNEGSYTYFWSSTEYGAYDGVYRLNLYKKVAVLDWEYKTSNLSVRCVKNAD